MARRTLAIRLAMLLALWAVWEIAARSGLFYEGIIPSSFLVLDSMGRHVGDPVFYGHLARTLYEVLAGFALGSAIGLAGGIVVGAHRFTDEASAPYLHGFASTPKIVFLPILMLLFGAGPGSKVGMGAFSAFFPAVIAVAAGMAQVSPVHVKVARGFNASFLQIVRKIYLPSLVAPAITGMRLGLGVAIIGVLLAEIKFSDRGLGHLAIQHYNFFRVADMYAVLLLTFALAVLANALMGRVGKALLRRPVPA
ncbi:MAG: ABC transporter permease [Alphaproteobacteria bacterium]|nr:ABC transporter permease [Alphaproteobacteria bacterium]